MIPKIIKSILSYCFIFFCLMNAHGQQKGNKYKETIMAASNSLEAFKVWPKVFAVTYGDSSYFYFDKKTMILYLKQSLNQEMVVSIFKVCDSLSRTNSYWNKVMAHEINKLQISSLNSCVDTSIQKDMYIRKILNSEINNCLKFQDFEVVNYVDPKYLTDTILNKLNYYLMHPYRTKEEATILFNGYDYAHQKPDTVGFYQLRKNYYKLNDSIQRIFREKEDIIYRANRANQKISVYLDSLEVVRINDGINSSEGTVFIGEIIRYAAYHKLTQLSPSIEGLKNVLKPDYYARLENRINLALAKLNYKDYRKKTIDKYTQEIDSLYKVNPSELNNAFSALTYINCQDALFALAPLLLIKDAKMDYDYGKVSYASYYFMELNSYYILNFPWDISKFEWGKNNERFDVDAMYIDNKMSKDFLDKMYQWMVHNRGAYKLGIYK